MVYAHDSKSCLARVESSSLSSGTNASQRQLGAVFVKHHWASEMDEKAGPARRGGGVANFFSRKRFVTESLLRRRI